MKLTELTDKTYKNIFLKRYIEQRSIVLERGSQKYFKHSICYEIWTVTHNRPSFIVIGRYFKFGSDTMIRFLIYVTLNIFISKLTELADRAYKKYILKRRREQKKHSFGKRTKQIFWIF